MEQYQKRSILPMKNYEIFLQAAKVEFNELVQKKGVSDHTIDDFDCIRTLGTGAFGRVLLAKSLKTDEYSAIKILDKSRVVKSKQVKHVINEKRILQALNHPFTVYLKYMFHDFSYVYLVLPLVSGGEMFTHLRNMRRFDEQLSKFYAAQVVLVFEYLHFCDMVYRDLKPENLLIDNKGYIKVTDFGFCKMIKDRTYTMCGTPEYLAPEIILSKGYGRTVDWWSFGILLFEMSAGYPPFFANDPVRIYEKVIAGAYNTPKYFSPELGDLVTHLLTKDLSRRYGNLKHGIQDIKSHRWFEATNWLALINGNIQPPYIPPIKGPDGASNFESKKEKPLKISNKNQFGNVFDDF